MKKCILLIMLLFIAFRCMAQTIVINEVAYTNKNDLYDSESDSPDWFELLNISDQPVNLSGYKVTDDTSKTVFWTFPDYNLEPGGFLLVFASGKDKITGSEFHTSFKLGNMRESLFLISPSGEIIDEIKPVCVPVNHSLARIPDGSGELTVTIPTPRSTNNNSQPVSVNYIRDTLVVNYKSGFYTGPISVALSHNHPENVIMYTLDADDPEEDSEIYTEPFLFKDLTPGSNRFANKPDTEIEPGSKIFKANVLRAVVYSNGCPASNEISNTYFISEDMKNRYTVPVVSLITDEDNLFDDETGIYVHGKYRNFDQHGSRWERPAHVEVFDAAGNQIIDQDAGIRIHGRGSRWAPQKSLRLYADKEYGAEFFEYPFFEQKPHLDKFKILLMRTTSNTRGPLFKEEMCSHLVQNMNIDYSASETAIMFINGEYWGIYNLMERQNKEYVESNYGVEDADVDIIAYDLRIVVEEGTIDEYNDLISCLQSTDPSSDAFFQVVKSKIDIDAMIDYYIAEMYFANNDWPFNNLEMWKLKNDTARWRYFFFDIDAGMMWVNNDHLTEYNNRIDKYQQHQEFCTIILKTLMNNDEFRTLFHQRFHYHMNTAFKPERVIETIDRYEEKYAPMVPEHIYRWHRPFDYRIWQEHVRSLRTFAIQRPLFIMEQLRQNFGNPVFVYPNPCNGSFRIEFLNPEAEADIKVYTLNGTLVQQWNRQQVADKEFHLRSELPRGMYILHIHAGMFWYPVKLAVQ